MVLVVVWAPSYFWIRNAEQWQLIIHTTTAIITFLIVALLQNGDRRSDAAIQGKLNALADALAELIATTQSGSSADLEKATKELRAAIGIEEAESS